MYKALASQIPIRIGVNAGSLEKNLLEKYGHPTAEKSTPKVSRQQSSVVLSMQHALSKISFKVMKGKEQTVTTEDYVKKVELTSNNAFVTAASPATEVTMQLTDGTLTGTLTTGTLTLTATTGTSEQGQIATWTEGGSGGTADF